MIAGRIAVKKVLPFGSGVAQSPSPPGRKMKYKAGRACHKHKLRDS
jgi:hypothetical protein